MSVAASAATRAARRPLTYRGLQRSLRQQRKIDKIRKLDYKPTWNLYVGDRVEILTGQDRGKQGLIKEIMKSRNRVVIEGLRLRKRKEVATMQRTGYEYMQEGTIHVSNVNLVDPETGKRTRIKMGTLPDQTKVRVSVQTQNIIPKPQQTTIIPVHHPITDTNPEDVLQVTYVRPDYSLMPKKPLLPMTQLFTPQLVGTALIELEFKREAERQAKENGETTTTTTTSSESKLEDPSPSWYPPPHWSLAMQRRMRLFRLKLTGGQPHDMTEVMKSKITGSRIAHTIKKNKKQREEQLTIERRVRQYRYEQKKKMEGQKVEGV